MLKSNRGVDDGRVGLEREHGSALYMSELLSILCAAVATVHIVDAKDYEGKAVCIPSLVFKSGEYQRRATISFSSTANYYNMKDRIETIVDYDAALKGLAVVMVHDRDELAPTTYPEFSEGKPVGQGGGRSDGGGDLGLNQGGGGGVFAGGGMGGGDGGGGGMMGGGGGGGNGGGGSGGGHGGGGGNYDSGRGGGSMNGYGQPGHTGSSLHGSNRQGDTRHRSPGRDSWSGNKKKFKKDGGR
jgi:hypothetical protein